MPDDEDPTATNHHDTALDVRTTLLAAHDLHTGRAELDIAGDEGRHGHTMAAAYSYALSAVLGWVGRVYGTEALAGAAFLVDELLTNGDGDDLNGDVTDGTAAAAVSAYAREAGDLTAEFARAIRDAAQGVPARRPYVVVEPSRVAAVLAHRAATLLEEIRRDSEESRVEAGRAGWVAACQRVSDSIIERRDTIPRIAAYRMGLEDAARIARATEPPGSATGD